MGILWCIPEVGRCPLFLGGTQISVAMPAAQSPDSHWPLNCSIVGHHVGSTNTANYLASVTDDAPRGSKRLYVRAAADYLPHH